MEGEHMDTKTLQKGQDGKVKFALKRMADGRLEVTCKHEIGHTISAPKEMGKSGFLHNCDGCCRTEAFKLYAAKVNAKRKRS